VTTGTDHHPIFYGAIIDNGIPSWTTRGHGTQAPLASRSTADHSQENAAIVRVSG